MKNKGFSPSKQVVLVGICAAITECGKLVLSAIPNVEVVTLITALFSYCFGVAGIISTFVFVIIEALVWGFGTWVPTYLIYWPLLSVLFFVFGKIKLKNRWLITLCAVFMTFLFGIISSFVEIGLFSGRFDNFFYRFGIYYMRGLPFYLAMLITNLILFPALFPFLSSKLTKLTKRFFG